MDRLEQYIRDHREAFETDPPEGHAERFRKRFEQRRRWKNLFLPFLRMTGGVTLFLLSSLWVLEHSGLFPRRQATPEYMEAEMYYVTQVNARISSIRQMHFIGDSIQKQILFRELSGMDSLYLELQHELQMNPGDERLLQAMTEYYEVKLEVLNHIIRQLSALQSQKEKNHESQNL